MSIDSRPAPALGQTSREVLLSLAGLWLGDELYEESAALLAHCADHLRSGLLPTRWPLSSADRERDPIASLYFVEAVRLLVAYGRSQRWVESSVYDAVLDTVRTLSHGSRDAGMDDDGLFVVRGQKTIAAQALWHNALRTAADLALARNSALLSAELKVLAKRSRDVTEKHFWREKEGFLVKSLDDLSLVPESLLSLSLGYPMLDRAHATRHCEMVRKELLTPHGLRTVARSHAAYDGGIITRLSATGAVMPMWLGAYARALVFARGSLVEARDEIAQAITPLLDAHSQDDLVLDMPEAFTDDAAHTAIGRVTFPPSRAELLRAHDECLLGQGPSPEHVERPPSLVPLAMRWEVEI